MRVEKITENKKRFLKLLLLADEQEDMIDRYLERGEMFALHDGDLKGVCVVTEERRGVYEIKNLAVAEEWQGRGYGKKLVAHLFEHYADKCDVMLAGTGESPPALSFYKGCGFVFSHRVKNFFVDNYREPVFERGIRLVDMIYLKKEFIRK